MKTKTEKKHAFVGLRVPVEFYQDIQEAADELGLSVSAYIREVLETHIAMLRRAKKGHLLDDLSVSAWRLVHSMWKRKAGSIASEAGRQIALNLPTGDEVATWVERAKEDPRVIRHGRGDTPRETMIPVREAEEK